MVKETATTNATRWFANHSTEGKIAGVFTLLIDHHLIAARIADILGVHKSTVSRWISKLEDKQYIEIATDFLEHQKQLEQVQSGSASQTFKPYVEGPRASQARLIIAKLQSQTGGNGTDPLWSPLPGGIEGLIDIHRLDWNLPVDTSAPRKGMPPKRSLEAWARDGVLPRGGLGSPGLNRSPKGMIHFSAPDIDSNIGPWKVLLRRKAALRPPYTMEHRPRPGELHQALDYGDWCAPHPIRVYRPSGDRWHITAEEAMDRKAVERRIYNALFEVIAEIQRRYHFTIGLPRQASSQVYEAGVLRYDPPLAEYILRNRQTDPNALRLAPGITADGSHDLLHEGFVHLDTPDPRQAAMQITPVATLSHIMQTAEAALKRTLDAADESVEIVQEHGVRATDTITAHMERQLGTIVDQLRNSMVDLLQQQQQWHEGFAAEEHRRAEQRAAGLETQDHEDRENAVARINRAIDRFERRLRGARPDRPLEQMTLFDFTADELPDEDDR
jgi:hypothetical protein